MGISTLTKKLEDFANELKSENIEIKTYIFHEAFCEGIRKEVVLKKKIEFRLSGKVDYKE